MKFNYPNITKSKFYILSWTWGIILTLIGLLVCSSILLYGVIFKKNYKLKKHGWCYYLNVGKSWGGLELGMFFLTDSKDSNVTKWHEHGHAIQNCFWGPLMLFVICIPSAIRYWYRKIKFTNKGIKPEKSYDSIWFEKQATVFGRYYKKKINNI